MTEPYVRKISPDTLLDLQFIRAGFERTLETERRQGKPVQSDIADLIIGRYNLDQVIEIVETFLENQEDDVEADEA